MNRVNCFLSIFMANIRFRLFLANNDKCNARFMLICNMLQHSFDISVAIRAVRNLLAANWVGVRGIAFAWSDYTGVLFELSGWNFQRLSRIVWATKWHWQQFFCNFSSRIWWQLWIILDKTMHRYISLDISDISIYTRRYIDWSIYIFRFAISTSA